MDDRPVNNRSLSNETAKRIIRAYKQGDATHRSLAQKFGVPVHTVHRLLAEKTYKHIDRSKV